MRKQNTRQVQIWLMLLMVLSAVLLGFLIVWLVGGQMPAGWSRRQIVLGASDATSTAAPTPRSVQARATDELLPTPTFVPVTAETLPPSPEPPTEAQPTPTLAPPPPTEVPPTLAPTRPPDPIVPPTQPPRPPVPVTGSRVRLEDGAWQGSYRQARGYAGRSATWIYGTGTPYHTMQARFTLEAPPQGTAQLSVEGMDSEDRTKTPIEIAVNGTPIYRGPNPLPNDDQPLATGTWATQRWTFDAGLLRAGENTIRIRNLAPGQFGLPPFFMLDYADVVFGAASNPPAAPEPTSVPSPPTPEPTSAPEPAPPTPEPTSPLPPEPSTGTSRQIRLEDGAWQGGYRQARGYAGRSATWIYGTGTPYHTMQARFTLEAPPQGTAQLSVEGMDSEDRTKTPIEIAVNGTPIYRGPNPLPNDDQPLATGTWATQRWTFDAGLLRAGENTIRIRNLAPGQFGLPPFFMLDYADVSVP
ncbi:MAG TPA: hypothetical protein VFZ66_11650 [Herpetosiphonaceae bacterium]